MVVGGLQPSEREALEGGDTLHGERTYIAYMCAATAFGFTLMRWQQ